MNRQATELTPRLALHCSESPDFRLLSLSLHAFRRGLPGRTEFLEGLGFSPFGSQYTHTQRTPSRLEFSTLQNMFSTVTLSTPHPIHLVVIVSRLFTSAVDPSPSSFESFPSFFLLGTLPAKPTYGVRLFFTWLEATAPPSSRLFSVRSAIPRVLHYFDYRSFLTFPPC